MLDIKKLLVSTVLGLGVFGATALAAPQWYRVARIVYPGGTFQASIPLEIDVETTDVAVLVPQYCAPRAVASQALVTYDDGRRTRTRLADLRFVSQDVVGGNIRARYRVALANTPTETLILNELRFSFVPVPNRFNQACAMEFYAWIP